jgi:hypothetical protein
MMALDDSDAVISMMGLTAARYVVSMMALIAVRSVVSMLTLMIVISLVPFFYGPRIEACDFFDVTKIRGCAEHD